jgi:hypothetical protein
MVRGWEWLRILGSKRAMMEDWGKGWVKYSREMWVPNGEAEMICYPARSISFLCWVGLEEPAYLGNVVVEPFRAQCSIRTSIIPVVVARHVLQDIVHSLRRDMREERFDEALVRQVGKVCKSVNKSTD